MTASDGRGSADLPAIRSRPPADTPPDRAALALIPPLAPIPPLALALTTALTPPMVLFHL